jgi:DNA-binding NarL/FixJ family response regulator
MIAQIHIVSEMLLQNELLASFLEGTTGGKCFCHRDTIRFPLAIKSDSQNSVVLLDYLGIDMAGIWAKIALICNKKNGKCFIVLFNVSPKDALVEEEAVYRGLQGIFYTNVTPPAFAKGIQSILKGELWFSRNTMMKCLSRTRNFTMTQEKRNAFLTSREQEIITLIASGLTNQEISDNLNISPHTVRTHVYNLFKKINTTNRIQASLWAAKHL